MNKKQKNLIEKTILSFLEERTKEVKDYVKEDGVYVCVLNNNYGEKLEEDIINSIVQSNDPKGYFYEIIYSLWSEAIENTQVYNRSLIAEELEQNSLTFPKGMDREAYDYLVDTFEEYSIVNPPFHDYFRQVKDLTGIDLEQLN